MSVRGRPQDPKINLRVSGLKILGSHNNVNKIMMIRIIVITIAIIVRIRRIIRIIEQGSGLLLVIGNPPNIVLVCMQAPYSAFRVQGLRVQGFRV